MGIFYKKVKRVSNYRTGATKLYTEPRWLTRFITKFWYNLTMPQVVFIGIVLTLLTTGTIVINL